MLFTKIIHLGAVFGLFISCRASALPDIQLPSLPTNATSGAPMEFDVGPISSPGPLTDRPVRYNVPGSSSRVVLILDWHLTKFQQRETDFLMLRALDRLVQTAIGMSKGDEPILNGRVIFRSPSLKLVAQDHVLLGGFTYGVLATAIRGLGELVYTYGANGVDVDVYAGGNKMVGTLEFDFIL